MHLALLIYGVVATLILVAWLSLWSDTIVGAVVALEGRGWHVAVGLCVSALWPILLVGVPVLLIAMIGRRRFRIGVVDLRSYRADAGG
ncbi:MAG: hypothetical protein IRY91_08380 [Gemmatimonadaceae bacterium]|nr:hypothetical protein [Gemmatimonadaceae bacterium]